jgi:chromosome segregation ATPase
MSYITRREAEITISRHEGYIDDLGNADITEISSAYDELRDSFQNLESEMSNVLAEHEEYEGALDEIEERFGSTDPDDWDELNEIEAWRELGDFAEVEATLAQPTNEELAEKLDAMKAERDDLRKVNRNQQSSLRIMFDLLAELHGSTALESVLERLSPMPVASDKQVVLAASLDQHTGEGAENE